MIKNRIAFAESRYATYEEQVLEPAVYPLTAALTVSAARSSEALSYGAALSQEYHRVETGWRWGPAWSTVWFRITGQVPAGMAGHRVVLRFSTGTEALLWRDAQPQQGLDVNHQTCVLFESARGGETIDVHVEAVCNRALGITPFRWEDQELRRRWREPEPGRLERCELAACDPVVWRLWQAFGFARQLMLELPPDSVRAQRLCLGLNRAVLAIDDGDVSGSAPAALQILQDTLRGAGRASQTRCSVIGHAHLDTAWLWPIRETKRKLLRTVATAVTLLDRFPEMRFMHSQPQHYVWLEQEAPGLFARVAEHVRAGRWEAAGPMWVEPDCNIPSGESLIRQIVHGVRYWREKFGAAAPQRYLYLPDTFGYPATIPQLMKLSGLDTFLTNKMTYNETNEFPHVCFTWRGVDGSEVLAHCMPGRDYNCAATPGEFLRAESKTARLDRSGAGLWLQPIGFGDGGGGPAPETIVAAEFAGVAEGLPEVRFDSIAAFCDALHDARDQARRSPDDWPVWDGELYLERHRGTLTTCAWLKRENRRAEHDLRAAEWLTFGGPVSLAPPEIARARQHLDEAWKLLLLNQFHDILPGSSIAAVYDDARVHIEGLRRTCRDLIDAGLKRWSEQLDTTDVQRPMIVFNPGSVPRSGVVQCEGEWHHVDDVPPLGAVVVDRNNQLHTYPVSVQDGRMSNQVLEVTIDRKGQIASLRHRGLQREACQVWADGTRRPLNQLMLYEDRPRTWEAWDIDPEYREKAFPVDELASDWSVTEKGPLRAVIEVTRSLSRQSRITQRFILLTGAPRLDVHTRVEWRERRRLLRVLFPVAVRASHATYDVSLGHVHRPTHHNTPWDQARFESCAHGWMNMEEPGFGVAILNDCKYGHSCHDATLGLTLLRSPEFPAAGMDIGEHEFTYSVMLHDGDWRRAGVDREAEALNAPLLAIAAAGARRASRRRWTPITITSAGPAQVQVLAFKGAESDDRLVVRLLERHGGRGVVSVDWHLPVTRVQSVDLLEQPLADPRVVHDHHSRRTTIRMEPFAIVTLAAAVGRQEVPSGP